MPGATIWKTQWMSVSGTLEAPIYYSFYLKGGSGRLLMPGPLHMIQVTRLNGTPFTLNALYIETD